MAQSRLRMADTPTPTYR